MQRQVVVMLMFVATSCRICKRDNLVLVDGLLYNTHHRVNLEIGGCEFTFIIVKERRGVD